MALTPEELLDRLKYEMRTHVEFKRKFMADDVQKALDSGSKFIDYYDMVMQLGEGFIGQERPAWLDRMEPQQCYSNTAELVMNAENLDYYEGYAIKAGLFMPVAHAWAVDNTTGQVIDATWEDPETSVYLGIRIDVPVLIQSWEKTGYNAVLESDWMSNCWFLMEGWKQLTCAKALELAA